MEPDIVTDKTFREIKVHGTADFPFCIGYENILRYKDGRFSCHWHKEVELTYLYSGRMYYQVNEAVYPLTAGDCLFINANALHMGWAAGSGDCSYCAVTLNPAMLGNENGIVWKRYIDPILNQPELSSFLFREGNDFYPVIRKNILQADDAYRRRPAGYEMDILSSLASIWKIIYLNARGRLTEPKAKMQKYERIRAILSYLHGHYQDKITLRDMAEAANISKSECSHSFKDYMHETPFEYLLRYRVERSMPVLEQTDDPITEIALSHGFSSASYYTETFRRYEGVTPREHRRSVSLQFGKTQAAPPISGNLPRTPR